jgi:hypothetical protein
MKYVLLLIILLFCGTLMAQDQYPELDELKRKVISLNENVSNIQLQLRAGEAQLRKALLCPPWVIL